MFYFFFLNIFISIFIAEIKLFFSSPL
uniref:Uncharacterized protein n=1 Tax=Arundo donax TaxID=35708 RepID=A0A0A9EH78_ARUDO